MRQFEAQKGFGFQVYPPSLKGFRVCFKPLSEIRNAKGFRIWFKRSRLKRERVSGLV